MTAIEDLLEVLQLLPGFLALFEQLVKSLGNKDQALLVTMAALTHPAAEAGRAGADASGVEPGASGALRVCQRGCN